MSLISVVGGAYAEDCSHPHFQILRGSGFRAAAVLRGLDNSVNLHTVTGPSLGSDFRTIAERKEIELQALHGAHDIWFRYRHPLAHPDIYPPNVLPFSYHSVISVDNALVFGMLEGRPQVSAKRAVYDPQDGFRAKPFRINGSAADELAIIASWSEGRALTQKQSPLEIAACLLEQEQCVAAVIKCGPQGALVATGEYSTWIKSFPSTQVWKIGSGDVFSAAFSHAWLVEDMSALQAAWFASRVTCEYVSTRKEQFTAERIGVIRQEARAAIKKSRSQPSEIPRAQIYLAGPFFSTSQQWLVDEARSALKDMGFNVFSPIHEIGLGPPKIVAPADLYELERSGLVVALLDGLDAGTLFEVGYARARAIPVIGIAESIQERQLTMLLGSGCVISNDFASGIYTACWHLMGDA